MTELCKLAVKHGTDKSGYVHQFTPMYSELFADRRDSVKRVLEIGIGHPSVMGAGYRTGASLFMWEEYFPNAEIIGLDVNRNALINQGRIRSFFCDQSNHDSLLTALGQTRLDFDLIVDDGSHVPADQILTAWVVAPALARQGVYVLEDLVELKPEDLFPVMSADFVCSLVECPCERDPHEKVIQIRRA